MGTDMKVCRECLKIKALGDFYPRPRAKDGHTNMCKSCHGVKSRLYFRDHRERVYAYKRRSRERRKIDTARSHQERAKEALALVPSATGR